MSRRIPPPRRVTLSRHGRSRVAAISAIAGLVAGLVLFVLTVALVGGTASAEDEITVAPNHIVVADTGSTTEIATQPVPAHLVGLTCELRVIAENGSSIHPGNTLIVTTGDSTTEAPGIEDKPDGSVVAAQTVVIGDSIVLELLMGPDGISSLGFSVGFDCLPEVTTTTTTPPPPPPTVLPAQQLPATTTAPALALPLAPAAEATVGTPDYTG